MRKRFAALLLALLAVIIAATAALGEVRYPDPQGYVNDFANILPDDSKRDLETKLRDFEERTTNEIAVVTVSSLEDLSIEDYTIRLAEKWKVGKEGKDNGLILLVAPNERKVRIEVGYGLEPIITDGKAGRIIQEMTPYFKQNNYAGGIKLGVEKIIENIGYLTPEERAAQNMAEEERSRAAAARAGEAVLWFMALLVVVGLAIVVARLISSWRREKARQRQEKSRLDALRQKISQEIPDLTQEKDALWEEVVKADRELRKKYLPHNHIAIAGLLETAGVFFLICGSNLDRASRLRVKNPDKAYVCLEDAKDLVGQMKTVKKQLKDFDNLNAEISQETARISKGVNDLSMESAIAEMALLREEAPNEVWADLERDLTTAENLEAELHEIIAEVENLNSAKVQKFTEAKEKLFAAQDIFAWLTAAIAAPASKRLEFEGARSKASSLKTEIEEKLRKAESKVGDSDVDHRSSELLAQARTKLKEAETQEQGSPVNWILVAMLLGAAISLANKSYREAEDAIDAASRRRRRSYHDSNRRRRDDENDDRGSIWVSPGSDSGGDSGGGFGGFGGGSFGGGGASGSW